MSMKMNAITKNILKLTFVAATMFMMMSCSKNLDLLGMFTSISDSPNERFEQSMQYNKSHGYDRIYVNQDNYRLYVVSDSHVDNSTKNLDRFVNDYLADSVAAPFALHLGDQINAKDHWDYYKEHVAPIADAGRTLYHALGNHDIYFDQWNEFKKRWNTSVYWFDVVTPSGAADLFIALDSASGTLGTDQREWLGDLLKDKSLQGYRNIIIFTHSHFFKKDTSQGHTSNFTMEETYDLTELFAGNGVNMVLQGHSHARDITVFKDVTYLRLDAIEDIAQEAYYAILNIGDNINYEFIKVN